MDTKLSPFALKNPSGFSLIEVLVVSAIMGGMALVSTQMISNQLTSSENVEKKMAINSVIGEARELLSSKSNCTATFGGVDIGALPVTVPKIVRSDGVTSVDKFVVGTIYESNSIKLNSIKVKTFTVDPSNPLNGEVVAELEWQKLGKYYGPEYSKQDLNMQVTINGSDLITDCHTSFGAGADGDIWQTHTAGIYFDDATTPLVAIGDVPNAASPALLQVDGSAEIGANASTSYSHSFAIGGTSSGQYSSTLGERALASQQGAIALGSGSDTNIPPKASASGAIAIGSGNTWSPNAAWGYNKGPLASGEGSIAIGSALDDASLTYWSSVSEREGAEAAGFGSIAIGSRATAKEDISVAIGPLSETGGNTAAEDNNRPGGTTVGFFSYATDSYTTSLGYMARSGQNGTVDSDADNGWSVAIGSESEAQDRGSISIGHQAIAGQYAEDNGTTPNEGDYAISLGYQAKAYDESSLAIGKGAISGNSTINISDPHGISIGTQALTNADYAIGIGYTAKGQKLGAIAIGQNTNANGAGSVVIGKNASTTYDRGIAIGEDAIADDVYGIAIGYGANADLGGAYDGPIAIGYNATSVGRGIAIGYGAIAEAGSYVIGYNSQARGDLHIAIGGDIKNTSSTRNIVIGYGAEITSNVAESMVISANWDDKLDVTQSNKFIAHFENGFKFCTDNGNLVGTDVCAEGFHIKGDGTTAALSDRNSKTNIDLIDSEEFLDRFLDLDLYWWNYKTAQEEENRHLGPMAQDFKKAFGTYGEETHINQVDLNGVALAGIKGLAIKNKKLEDQVRNLAAENEQLKARLERLESIVEKMAP